MSDVPKLKPPQSCCWMRILRVQEEATVPTRTKWVAVHDYSALHGNRPPSRIAAEKTEAAVAGGPIATWHAHPDYFGRSDANTVFDYGPVFCSEEKAVEWLNGPEGRQWDSEALNRCLISVSWHDGVSYAEDEPKPTPKPNHDTDFPAKPGFPASAWSQGAIWLHKPELPDQQLFDPEALAKDKCPNISTFDTTKDCQAVCDAAVERLEQDGLIRFQAQGLAQAIQPVLSVIGLNLDHPIAHDWKRLISELTNTVEPAIFCAKRIHRRQRPAQHCGPAVTRTSSRLIRCPVE